MKYVYLSGVMTDKEITKLWREDSEEYLNERNIGTLNPWRGKCKGINLNDALIVDRDYSDMKQSDLFLMNLNDYDCDRQMIGTWAELGIAHALQKPVIAFGNPADKSYEHPFVNRICTAKKEDLQDALEWVVWFLG